mgnify:CR=1 FL=1
MKVANATEYKIETGIAIPKRGASGRALKYPLPDMEIGDSFLVPRKLKVSVSAAVAYYGKKTGKRFTVQIVEDGVRIWRIEDRKAGAA